MNYPPPPPPPRGPWSDPHADPFNDPRWHNARSWWRHQGYDRHHHRHGWQPWMHHWPRDPNDPLYTRWQQRQRALFRRFALTFGTIILLIVTGMAILAYVFGTLFGHSGQVAILTWVGGCSLAMALPLVGLGVAVRASRNITGPLADVMAAADAVANGDLSVRVAEVEPRVPGRANRSEFSQLARTFNHMVDELQRIDEQRRNLTADVAHELRTPLHIIQGNLEGILDGVYQPTPEHIQMLLEETRVLSRLIEDLRTLAMAESGHLILHKEPVQVAELLADLATSFRAQAEAAGIELRVETASLAATTIQADVMRLNQILANLVVNAIRYTPSGGSITLRGEAAYGGGIRLTVSDTGQGISPEDLPHIFDRFWRGDPARSHKDGAGGGLGLAIVKQLVELHGGDVTVRSQPGVGTVFTVVLPDSVRENV